MAIPKLKKQDVIDALKFIDENGVPKQNESTRYMLVGDNGKKYPPKYVVAVADHLANGTDISTPGFNADEAKKCLKEQGFTIETKQQEKFELTITAESVESTDERFTMDNLSLGDNYKPLDACFKRANGDVIKRAYSKGERRNSNQTLPRIACQVFEKQLAALSVEDKENFPVCKYNPDSDVIRGIYASVDDFKKHRNTIEYLTYGYDNGRQFVIYCWNIFSTIIFVQECLKRFGEPGDLFKKYIRRRYNDGNVKGTIDVARHIEENTPFVGNVAYSQREFSYDNSLMELVRHTIEFIKRKPYGNKLLIKVKDEVKLVIDATPGYEPYDRQKIIEQNKKNTVRHAYFREYLALQRLCLLILRHQKHQIGTGARQIYGILFDGAWMWEEYINLLIEDIFYHPMNKSGTGAQRLFDGNVGLIYPDFISRNSEPRIIADAKYKPIDNIGNRDYLQVLAYMFRFDAKAGYYLYPEAEGSDDLKLWLNRGSAYEENVVPRDDISITKHGLKIPMDAQNYSEFKAKMKAQEQEFTSVFYA